MPRIRQEITVWDKSPNVKNQIYITEKQTLVGYVPSGTNVAVYFSKPLKQWSPARRKFRDLTKKEIKSLQL